ncbi:MAG: DUF1330 domain-containing protein [Deltaproteobacteria bacterium]|nr:DUF1330 domain-containing protein [Deltaproteobacteria bacterium]
MPIVPTDEQLGELLADTRDTPVVMINLLRFKAEAEGDKAIGGESGEAAYMRYAESMRRLVESGGGRFLWVGKVDQVVIGDTGERFDAAALVEYPSRSGFIEMAMKAEQTGISGDRAAGLDSQWLFASTTGFSLVEDRANDQADD